VREVLEETGLRTEPLGLVGIYSDPERDPRGHIVSAVFHLRVVGGELHAGDDADSAALFDLNDLPELASTTPGSSPTTSGLRPAAVSSQRVDHGIWKALYRRRAYKEEMLQDDLDAKILGYCSETASSPMRR
jgi:hypothetical protein